MRDRLPCKPNKMESMIVNLDSSQGPGTHWVCFVKSNSCVVFYNSFGDLSPCPEIQTYLKDCIIKYNFDSQQNYNTFVCGHLCLLFLLENEAEKVEQKFFNNKLR
uniref:Uncharacterized protein n=1 Tax=Cacopsylla melanoneura TaxID=428564 RepID=A0A8D8QWM4_9HEMI